MKLILFKTNPERIPGRGGPEWLAKESDIEIVDPELMKAGDEIAMVDRYFNIVKKTIKKVRWDNKAITVGAISTLSFEGNPFGASPSSAEHELEKEFPLFPNKEMAEKFVEIFKKQIGHDDGGTIMCPKPTLDKIEWHIAGSYSQNKMMSYYLED